MSHQETRSLVNLFSTLIVTGLYAAYMIQRYPEAAPYSPEIFRFWGAFFLILIPVSIVARIITYIVFHIAHAILTREEPPTITDERDKSIELKAQTGSGYLFILGFILAMGSLVIDTPPTVMFIILLLSGFGSQVLSEMLTFYFYRRGF